MSGLLLRLAGPMQSWGEHSAFGERDTLPHPSRSGLVGMFAAAQGVGRDEPLDRYDALRLTVRVDSPGLRMSDFQTVGGGLPRERTVPTAEGKRRPENATTIVTRKAFLADAVFTVAVTGPGTEDIGAALVSPHWQTYLGRRSFVPDPLLLLRRGVADPVEELRTGVPLPRVRVPEGAESVPVDLVVEGGADGDDPRTGGDAGRSRTTLNDVPRSFASLRRLYASREVRVDSVRVPVALVSRGWRDYQDRLFAYVKEHR
ncbi:type I-E CRISPR-associated protein Cas5/CasD [Nocardiopsis sp. NPDC101807]|uniref:type I-E CRISPR-associated protein Cas5/CasD n=1 Tax=Nocardiopsis sp. NPDC101807 TaxID=3364339 RepID=UPI0037F38E86